MKKKILEYVKVWEKRCYSDGIPDEAPIELENRNKVPSYRKICMAILKNDNHLQTLGFSRPKSKYYSLLKKIEIEERL